MIEWYTVESAASERQENKEDSSNKRWGFWSFSLSAGKSFLLVVMIFKASLALMSNQVFNSKRKLAFLFSRKTACLLAFQTFVAAFFKVMSGSPDGF